MLGTPQYMSPEQARGDRTSVGPQTDIWAMGVIMIECIAGVRPFEGATPFAVFFAVLEANPWANVDRSVWRPSMLVAVGRALRRPLDERLPSMAEFADVLAAGVR